MEQSKNVEIYQQRYETFRHLDKLRWQMLQIGIAAGSIVLAFGKGNDTQPEWWTWVAVGVVLFISGLAMMKIGAGIKRNAEVLSKAGAMIGDTDIPVPTSKFSGVAFWIAFVMMLTGITFVIYPIINQLCF